MTAKPDRRSHAPPGTCTGDSQPTGGDDGEHGVLSAEIREKIARDPFCRREGFVLEELRPGYARVSVRLSEDMLNFHGSAHGGLIFALADAAFAAASNSRGVPAVALTATIHYLRPARAGSTLVATATEENVTRRTALYRVVVAAPEGPPVATFSGLVYRKQ
jgi:acyl-CoA thioesterase